MHDYLSSEPQMHPIFVTFFIVLGALLAVVLAIYIVQAIRSRGKPPIERRAGGFLAGDPGSFSQNLGNAPVNHNAPGMFLINTARDPQCPNADREDPHRR